MGATMQSKSESGSLRAAVVAINVKFDKEIEHNRKGQRCRLEVGRLLLALRKRIEHGEAGDEWRANWRGWYSTQPFIRSYGDANKVMALARAAADRLPGAAPGRGRPDRPLPGSHGQSRNLLNNTHAHRQNQDLWGAIDKSEAEFKQELEPGEYEDAVSMLKNSRMAELYQQVPDTPQNMAIARQHGYQSPAHYRQAVLEYEAASLAQHALRNGISPAAAYYQAAPSRGHQTRTIALKSHMRQVLKEIDSVPDSVFDDWWDGYAKSAKYVEEVNKGRD